MTWSVSTALKFRVWDTYSRTGINQWDSLKRKDQICLTFFDSDLGRDIYLILNTRNSTGGSRVVPFLVPRIELTHPSRPNKIRIVSEGVTSLPQSDFVENYREDRNFKMR